MFPLPARGPLLSSPLRRSRSAPLGVRPSPLRRSRRTPLGRQHARPGPPRLGVQPAVYMGPSPMFVLFRAALVTGTSPLLMLVRPMTNRSGSFSVLPSMLPMALRPAPASRASHPTVGVPPARRCPYPRPRPRCVAVTARTLPGRVRPPRTPFRYPGHRALVQGSLKGAAGPRPQLRQHALPCTIHSLWCCGYNWASLCGACISSFVGGPACGQSGCGARVSFSTAGSRQAGPRSSARQAPRVASGGC
eukprot:jgi/Botrbrau1/3346/Bobra.0048s0040.1